MSWTKIYRRAASLAPGAVLSRLLMPRAAPPLCIEYVTASPTSLRSMAPQTLLDWFDGILLMAVPKKRVSYTRKRVRQAGQQRMFGPQLQPHVYMCPVCERMRVPHRVCGREDCRTYWKHRWF